MLQNVAHDVSNRVSNHDRVRSLLVNDVTDLRVLVQLNFLAVLDPWHVLVFIKHKDAAVLSSDQHSERLVECVLLVVVNIVVILLLLDLRYGNSASKVSLP